MTHSVTIGGQEFVMHPSGALYWVSESRLLISDVHLGKITHFRKYGAAVPKGATHRNFDKLQEVLEYFGPREICFMGDLFHSYLNREWILFEAWVKQCGCKLTLISGNHDIISPLKFEKAGLEIFDHFEYNGFYLTHCPTEHLDLFNIAGHIHPAVRLRGPGRQSMRLPCFHLRKNQLILPSFGAFTGSHVVHPEEAEKIFVLTDTEVFALENLELYYKR